jgi:hypothetical protein
LVLAINEGMFFPAPLLMGMGMSLMAIGEPLMGMDMPPIAFLVGAAFLAAGFFMVLDFIVLLQVAKFIKD